MKEFALGTVWLMLAAVSILVIIIIVGIIIKAIKTLWHDSNAQDSERPREGHGPKLIK